MSRYYLIMFVVEGATLYILLPSSNITISRTKVCTTRVIELFLFIRFPSVEMILTKLYVV